MTGEIGNIKEKWSCSVDWEIPDFSSLSRKTKDFYSSRTFTCCDGSWNLRIYPNGSTHQSLGWVSLYLNKQNSGTSPLLVHFEISIKDSFGIQCASGRVKQEFKRNECVGWPKYYLRSKLLDIMDLATPGSKLIVSCFLLCEKSAADAPLLANSTENSMPKIKSTHETLTSNLKDLFRSSSKSFVLIKVKDEKFPAHKGILSSRSSVFRREIMKNNSGTLEIEGFEPDMVKDLLLYIYCEELKDITLDNVFDLYAMSSKYDVKDLKEKCENFLTDNLTAETLCKLIISSKKCESLKDSKIAIKFLQNNASDILTTDEWKKFESENIAIAEEILKTIVLENALKINM